MAELVGGKGPTADEVLMMGGGVEEGSALHRLEPFPLSQNDKRLCKVGRQETARTAPTADG